MESERGAPTILGSSQGEKNVTAPDFAEIELALVSTAMAGDAGGLYRLASNLMDRGVPFDSLLFDYLMETERSVGQRWAQGDYLVAEEHAVTASIETVISLLAGMFDQPEDAAPVVIATAEGDDHSLPARALAAQLLFAGYRTVFLGADLPGDDLVEFLEADPPAAMVLSAAMSGHLLGARSVINAAHQAGVPVLVGGKAFGPDGVWAEVVGADGWVQNLRDVQGVIDDWVEDPPELSGSTELSPELAELVSNRSLAVARAEQALGQNPPSRLRDEVRLVISAVEGALLTGDDQVVVDMLEWQEASLNAYEMDAAIVVSAVREALGEYSEAGTQALSRAVERRSG